MKARCDYCLRQMEKSTGEVNRARKIDAGLYCNRRCVAMGKRVPHTKAERVEAKRLYDAEYRKKNRATLKAKKAAYFQRTYDPVKAARERKKNMARHVAYCRRPEYKVKKQAYDQKRRDSEYGPFAEVARLAINLNREIKQRSSNYEIRLQNQTLNKRVARTRAEAQALRHDSHSGA